MAVCMTLQGHAQNDNKQELSAFDKWRKEIHDDFEDFRRKNMEEFVNFVRNPWKEFEGEKPVPVPEEKPVPPVVIPEEDVKPKPDPKPVVIEEVVKPTPPVPQPKPVEPIEEVPVVETKHVGFTFFGTSAKVRFDKEDAVRLAGLTENAVADAMQKMAGEEHDNMIIDCLELRKRHALSDWAYLQMLHTLSETIYGGACNEAQLLTAYLYMQSGYRIRIATDGIRLYMLYASRHEIYGQGSFTVDGIRYYGLSELPNQLFICRASFPKEQSLSLYINTVQRLAERPSQERTIQSRRYPDLSVKVSTNLNLMDFYTTYPTSMINNDVCTRWAMYANTPMADGVRQQLYPQLLRCIEGKSQQQAVEMLLNWVQTGFAYEYDDKVWGHDRAFFAEESLRYPYCDCEDRSILFTRIVRDLLHLPCILVYYPGHLAAAVNFTDSVQGDFITLGGKRFVIADPTYIGAPIGRTMPDMDNMKAKVILLQ